MTRPALPLRAAIYARYSSENQREASIDDQIEVCRRLAEREGWRVVAVYDDRAVSGASAFRSGFAAMLADAERGQFDVVVCEALDRLGRRLADVAALYDRLSFRRVALHTSSEGRISELHIGLLGTMAQKFLSDLKDKAWRGQLGRVRAGRIPGGLAFGYEVVPPPPGSTEGGARRTPSARLPAAAPSPASTLPFAAWRPPIRLENLISVSTKPAAGQPSRRSRMWMRG